MLGSRNILLKIRGNQTIQLDSVETRGALYEEVKMLAFDLKFAVSFSL
jgi:hypothetical protein